MVEAEDLLIFKLRGKGKSTSAVEKPQTVEAARVEPAAEAAAPAKAAEPVQKPATPKGEGLLSGIFGGKKRELVQPEKAQAAQPIVAAGRFEVEPPVETQVHPLPAPQPSTMPERVERNAGKERDEAKGKFCEWHPWRPAYAVCDYCHRPFCYEDTVEFSHGYYCLEDIDKVSENFAQEMYASYSGISLISAGLFLFAFIAFVYFASGQLAYIFQAVSSSGLPNFLANLNYSYGSALLGLVVTGVGLFAAIFILIQSDKGFAIGLITGLAETVLFSYQFLSSGLLYMGIISAIGLVALMLLAYSKVSYEVPEQVLSEQSIYFGSQVGGGAAGRQNQVVF